VSDPAHSGECPRVIVISDVRLVGESVAQTLSNTGRIDACSKSRFLEADSEAICDAVMVDGRMDGGLDIVRAVRDVAPDMRVVVFGTPDSEQAILSLVEAGVSGYVDAASSSGEALQVIATTLAGEPSVTLKVVHALLHQASGATTPPRADDLLTPREEQILPLLREGLANKQIASRLSISNATVKNHVHNVLLKLGASSRRDLRNWA
jgi:DNA-binding NarL/FixJ family response regulator